MARNPLDVREKWRGRNLIRKLSRQRIRKGFASSDVWDMDSYLLFLLPAMLKELADMATGYPDGLFDSYEAWVRWLREEAGKFEAVRELRDEGEYGAAKIALKLALNDLGDHFFCLWD